MQSSTDIKDIKDKRKNVSASCYINKARDTLLFHLRCPTMPKSDKNGTQAEKNAAGRASIEKFSVPLHPLSRRSLAKKEWFVMPASIDTQPLKSVKRYGRFH